MGVNNNPRRKKLRAKPISEILDYIIDHLSAGDMPK